MTLALLAVALLAASTAALLFRRQRAISAELTRLRATFPEQQRKLILERDALLRAVLDASPPAIILYGDAGQIVLANAVARDLFFAGEDAEGQNFLRLVAQGPVAFRAALLGQSDEVASFEIDGQRESYHFARRIVAHAGEPHTLLIVRHVTREVARQELDVLKRVVRLLSHEVNNALAPVSSLVHSARQILKTGERMERLDTVFDTIDERAKHLAQFIAGYATLARLPPPDRREVPWDALLARLRTLYPEARIVAPADARGHFDAGQIEQALINLLKNAREAGGPADGIELEVRVSERGSELEVRDRGAGFSADALENAVLPFFTTKPGGSGVGLALVREVAEAHGGELRLKAREGGGAVVGVLIPDPRLRGEASSRARLTLTRG